MVPLASRTIFPLCAGLWIRFEIQWSVVLFVESSIAASSFSASSSFGGVEVSSPVKRSYCRVTWQYQRSSLIR